MSLPFVAVGYDRLRLDGPVPELDRLFVRTVIVDEAQSDQRAADEAATLLDDRRAQPFGEIGFDDDVVVEKQHVRREGLLEQELSLFREPAAREMAVDLDAVALRAQHAHDGLRDRKSVV